MSELNVKEYMAGLGRKARIASRVIAAAPTALSGWPPASRATASSWYANGEA